MPRQTISPFSGAALAAAALFAACSLDLDYGLIPPDDAGPDVSVGGAGAGGAAGSGAAGGGGSSGIGGFGAAPGDAGPCDSDKQCAIDGGCLEGKCSSGKCQYAICPAATACEGRSCDFAGNQCGEPQTLGFKLSQIEVGADLGCSGSAQRCIATAGDYVVVGTKAGLKAWHLRNPLSPVQVTLVPPPFAISRLVSNSGRILIVGVLAGTSLSIAWIDVPADDIPGDLVATSVAVNYSGALSAAYPADGDDFFLVHNDASEFFPAARLDLPTNTGSSLTLHPSTGIPAGQAIVASSGSRLLGYRTNTDDSLWVPSFSLETAAGTANAQNAGEQALPLEAPPNLGAHVFTSAHDGSVLWSTNRIVREDGDVYSDAVLLRWLLDGGSSSLGATSEVVLESYASYGASALYAGPSAVIDPASALASAAYPPDTGQSRVRGLQRSSAGLTLGGGSDVLPFSTSLLGVAATRRFGVVLTPSTSTPPQTPNAALRVYAPGCG
jgi:hypothetical protein